MNKTDQEELAEQVRNLQLVQALNRASSDIAQTAEGDEDNSKRQLLLQKLETQLKPSPLSNIRPASLTSNEEIIIRNEVKKLLQDVWTTKGNAKKAIASSSVIPSIPQHPVTKSTKLQNRHKAFLEHDLSIIQKMLEITRRFTSKEKLPNDSQTLLIELGRLAFEIKHDEEDPLCIRNQFGDYTDEKGKPREQRYKATGIPFQGLFYISKWLETASVNYIHESDLQAWITLHQVEFVSLHNKLSSIQENTIDVSVLDNIQQLCECANDMLHLDICIKALTAIAINDLNVSNSSSRYALSRIYSILGETAKCLSGTISNHGELKVLLQRLGQCRDLVKFPFVMPKTAARIKSAQLFLTHFGPKLLGFFAQLREKISVELLELKLDCISSYRIWLGVELTQAIHGLSLKEMETGIQQIKINFKAAKNEERIALQKITAEADIESDSDDEESEEIPLNLKEEITKALAFIRRYQDNIRLIEENKIKLRQNFGSDENASEETIKEKYPNKIREWRSLRKHIDNIIPNAAKINFDKYKQLYDQIPSTHTLPSPTPEQLIVCDLSTFTLAPKKSSRKRSSNSVRLIRCLQYVIELYVKLENLERGQSAIDRFAYDHCVAFLGGLFKEIDSLHQLVLQEPTSSVWDKDFGQTIQIRHRRLMHNLPNYDSQIIRKFVRESIMPWGRNFRAFSFIAQHSASLKKSKDEQISQLDQSEYPSFRFFFNHIGLSYMQLNQWDNAEKSLLVAHSLNDNSSSDDIACIMHNLADLYREKGDWDKAKNWLLSAWQHRQTYLAEDNRYYVSTQIHLGMCYEKLGEKDSALKCYQESLFTCVKHNLDQTHALKSLADFYADEMNFPLALVYYQQVYTQRSNDNLYRLHLLGSLISTLIECGEHEEAMLCHHEMKNLFESNKAYFKQYLQTSYSEFEEQLAAPIQILELIGGQREALTLLNTMASPSYRNKVLKLRLLRNTGQYDKALILGQSLLEEKEQGRFNDEDLLFTFEAIYADVLVHLSEVKEGVSRLEALCIRAFQLSASRGKNITQICLSPFNILSHHYMRQSEFEKAKHCLQSTIPFLDLINLSGLSNEVFITIINLYKVSLFTNDLDMFSSLTQKYQNFIIQRLAQKHDKIVCDTLAELINLLIEKSCFETADQFLTTMIVNNTIPKALQRNFTEFYMVLAYALVKAGNVDNGINMLVYFLSNHCREEDKTLCSFGLARLLMDNDKLLLLCQIVSQYHQFWDAKLGLGSMPPYKVYATISNLALACMNYKANMNNFDEAVTYAQICVQLLPKIYSYVVNLSDRSQFEIMLLQQFWRIPMAIAEFKHYDYPRLIETFFALTKENKSQFVLTQDAFDISHLFFGNQLRIQDALNKPNRSVINIPTHWKRFITLFNSCSLSINQIREPLKGLDFFSVSQAVSNVVHQVEKANVKLRKNARRKSTVKAEDLANIPELKESNIVSGQIKSEEETVMSLDPERKIQHHQNDFPSQILTLLKDKYHRTFSTAEEDEIKQFVVALIKQEAFNGRRNSSLNSQLPVLEFKINNCIPIEPLVYLMQQELVTANTVAKIEHIRKADIETWLDDKIEENKTHCLNIIIQKMTNLSVGQKLFILINIDNQHFTLLVIMKTNQHKLIGAYLDSFGDVKETSKLINSFFEGYQTGIDLTKITEKYQHNNDCAIHVYEAFKLLLSATEDNFNSSWLLAKILNEKLDQAAEATFRRLRFATQVMKHRNSFLAIYGDIIIDDSLIKLCGEPSLDHVKTLIEKVIESPMLTLCNNNGIEKFENLPLDHFTDSITYHYVRNIYEFWQRPSNRSTQELKMEPVLEFIIK